MMVARRIGALGYQWVRWGIGGVFIYAGFTKLIDPTSLAVLIEAYGLLPEFMVMPTTVALILTELVAGIGLLADVRGSLTVIATLLGLFIAILAYGLWMGLDVDCGCFGPDDPEAEAFHGLRIALIRDLVMLAGAAYLFTWRRIRSIQPVRFSFRNAQHQTNGDII